MLKELSLIEKYVSRELKRGFVQPLMLLAHSEIPVLSSAAQLSIAAVETPILIKAMSLGGYLTLGSPIGAAAVGILTLGTMRQILSSA